MEEYYSADDSEVVSQPSRTQRFRDWLSRVEKIYLEVLRAAALLVATTLLVWIAWLLIASTYKVSRDPDAVEVQDVEVTAAEVADIQLPESSASQPDRPPNQSAEGEQSPYERFRADYFALFQQSFEAYRQDGDEELSEEQFEERYLVGFQSLGDEDLSRAAAMDLEADAMEAAMSPDARPAGVYLSQSDFGPLLQTMREAAELPTTVERLENYRETPKVQESNNVRRTRQEEYCIYYSDYFGECLSYGTRSVPYTDTVTRMVPAAGVVDYRDLFGAYQESYLGRLVEERVGNEQTASEERLAREIDNAEGWEGYSKALALAAGFLTIMFFFLLIAIERHQRRLVRAEAE